MKTKGVLGIEVQPAQTSTTNNISVNPARTDVAISPLAALSDQPMLLDELHIHSLRQTVQNSAHVIEQINANMLSDGDDFWGTGMARWRPYHVSSGVLTIPVHGMLLDKLSVTWGGMMTGYDYISRAYERGMDDPGVEAILLDIDSPGGQAEGNFELVDSMREWKGTKPVVAWANGIALSGGYSLASVADDIIVRPTSSVGSVGVVTFHMELSGALENMGITLTVIRSGAHKAEGNTLEPLSDYARQDIQQRSDRFYQMFVERVAENRGMTESAVRATEARVYGADDGVSVGFADRVGNATKEMVGMVTRRTGANMIKKSEGRKTDKETDNEVSTVSTEQQISDAVAAAVDADRKRMAQVMGSEEYAGRESLGQHLLTSTNLAADSIIASMKAAPKASQPTAGTQRNHFAEAMGDLPNPEVGQEDPDQSDGRGEGTQALLSAWRRVGGAFAKPEHNEERA